MIFIYTCHTIRSFLWWRKYFSAQRFSRSNPQCPSHNQYPHLAIQRHQATAGAASSSSSSSPPLISEIKRQTCPFARAQWKEGGDEASSLLRHQSHGTATATYLSMDHIYIDFLSFLWGMTFIWPCTVLAGLKGVATMLVRGALCRQGLIQPKLHDPSHVVHTMFLHGTLAIHFVEFDPQGCAVFHFDNFPLINKDG